MISRKPMVCRSFSLELNLEFKIQTKLIFESIDVELLIASEQQPLVLVLLVDLVFLVIDSL